MRKSAPRFSAKLLPILIGIGISVILIVVFLVRFFSGQSVRDGAVERYIKMAYMYDADAASLIAPDAVWERVVENGGLSKTEMVNHLSENAFVYAENTYGEYGTDIRFSHDVTDSDDLDESAKKALSDTYGIALSAITEAETLTVDVTIEGNVKTEVETVTLTYVELRDTDGYIVEAFPILSRIVPETTTTE